MKEIFEVWYKLVDGLLGGGVDMSAIKSKFIRNFTLYGFVIGFGAQLLKYFFGESAYIIYFTALVFLMLIATILFVSSARLDVYVLNEGRNKADISKIIYFSIGFCILALILSFLKFQ